MRSHLQNSLSNETHVANMNQTSKTASCYAPSLASALSILIAASLYVLVCQSVQLAECHRQMSSRKAEYQSPAEAIADLRQLESTLHDGESQLIVNSVRHTSKPDQRDDGTLKRLLRKSTDASVSKRNHLQQLDTNKEKMLLKNKWHKLVDDIIDDRFDEISEPTLSAPLDNDQISRLDKPASFRRKKWMKNEDVIGATENNDKIMIILKNKPVNLDMPEPSDSSNTFSLLTNGISAASPSDGPVQKETSAKSTTNLDNHNQRILDDKFGIMKESIFTTNNHLGYKGVPKFGSEEEY